jgi:hypothetical protein
MSTVDAASAPLVRYCGRVFSPADLDAIRQILRDPRYPTRVAISRAVCETLDWRKPDGGLKEVSCRVALLRMQADGLLALPAPGRPIPRFRLSAVPSMLAMPGPEIVGTRGDLGEITLQLVRSKGESSRLWNELIARYHYLGYCPLTGAQLRYFATAGGRLLAAMGFGAAAWSLEPRDRFIGWSAQQRQSHLHLVVGQPRYLILPWVSVRYLASSLLGLAARQLPADWERVYGYRPVLLETFVQPPRTGRCYAAANWIRVGQTRGRGKLDRFNRWDKPVKDIWLYPLDRHFREILTGQRPPHTRPEATGR